MAGLGGVWSVHLVGARGRVAPGRPAALEALGGGACRESPRLGRLRGRGCREGGGARGPRPGPAPSAGWLSDGRGGGSSPRAVRLPRGA